jgi:hypothetical protein
MVPVELLNNLAVLMLENNNFSEALKIIDEAN